MFLRRSHSVLEGTCDSFSVHTGLAGEESIMSTPPSRPSCMIRRRFGVRGGVDWQPRASYFGSNCRLPLSQTTCDVVVACHETTKN